MRMRFWATILRPAFSITALMAPVRLRLVASGLMIEKVRSVAMDRLGHGGSCRRLISVRRHGHKALGGREPPAARDAVAVAPMPCQKRAYAACQRPHLSHRRARSFRQCERRAPARGAGRLPRTQRDGEDDAVPPRPRRDLARPGVLVRAAWRARSEEHTSE